MKKWIVDGCMAIAVTLIAAGTAHLVGVKSLETCFCAGVGAGIANLLIIVRRSKKERVRQA